jgi:hypothetical protein
MSCLVVPQVEKKPRSRIIFSQPEDDEGLSEVVPSVKRFFLFLVLLVLASGPTQLQKVVSFVNVKLEDSLSGGRRFSLPGSARASIGPSTDSRQSLMTSHADVQNFLAFAALFSTSFQFHRSKDLVLKSYG